MIRKARALSIVSATLAVASTLAIAQSTSPRSEGSKASNTATTADPLKGLRARKDEMNDVVFYEHPTSPKHRNANGIYLYFGKFGGGKYGPLRLVMQYHADSWLFVKRAWAKADGDTLDLPQEAKALGWERDNSGGSIWEWSDAPITKPEHAYAVKKMCSAKSTTVRFEGKQYYDDKKLAPAQTKAMCEVIAIYEKATGRLLP